MTRTVTDPADPQRCKALANRGEQCWNAAEYGECCEEHTKQPPKPTRAKQKRFYNLARISTKLAEVVEHFAVDSLEEEIATLRALILDDLEQADTGDERSKATARAKEGFLAVEKLVKTQHSLKETQGTMIPRSALLRFSQSLSNVITAEIRGLPGWEAISDRVGEKIMELAAKLGQGDRDD